MAGGCYLCLEMMELALSSHYPTPTLSQLRTSRESQDIIQHCAVSCEDIITLMRHVSSLRNDNDSPYCCPDQSLTRHMMWCCPAPPPPPGSLCQNWLGSKCCHRCAGPPSHTASAHSSSHHHLFVTTQISRRSSQDCLPRLPV